MARSTVKPIEVYDSDVKRLVETVCEQQTLNSLSPDTLEACARLKRALESPDEE